MHENLNCKLFPNYGIINTLYTGISLILVTLANATNTEMVDDPSALLQQYIPKSYLNLQKEIDKRIVEMEKKNLAPIMNKREFE